MIPFWKWKLSQLYNCGLYCCTMWTYKQLNGFPIQSYRIYCNVSFVFTGALLPILAQMLQVSGWPMSPDVAKWKQVWLHQEKNKVQERPSQSLSGIVWHSTTTDVCVQEKPPQSDRFGALLQRRVGRYHQVKMCHADTLLPKEAEACNKIKMCFIFPPLNPNGFSSVLVLCQITAVITFKRFLLWTT